MIDFRQLIDAGLHFGHQKSRWCPKMKPFIWGHRGGVHLIDISKTAHALQKTASFLESVASRGETILWVGTKKSAKNSIKEIAQELKMPYVNYRWVGGSITNYQQVKKAVTKLLHYEDVLEKSDDKNNSYTKKELGRIQKLSDRLERSVGGLKDLRMPIGAIVLVDVKKEQTAHLEAMSANVPVVGLVDTNADPSGVDYVIPGNDDSTKGVKFVLDFLKKAVAVGLKTKIEIAKKAKEEAALKRAEKSSKEMVKLKKAAPKVAPKKATPKVSDVKTDTAPKVEVAEKKEAKAPAKKTAKESKGENKKAAPKKVEKKEEKPVVDKVKK